MSDKETKQQPSLNLSPADLQAMIAAAVTAAVVEAKKPAPATERELANIKEAQELRAETASNVLAKIEAKKFEQKTCTHAHSTGESHGVYIVDGNYILCQKCQGKIRPEDGVSKDKSAIYDTALFNRLFQAITRTDM